MRAIEEYGLSRTLKSRLDGLVRGLVGVERVRTRWLFGSEACDESGSWSDVDLAVRTTGGVDVEERLNLQSTDPRHAGEREVELVLVNEANSPRPRAAYGLAPRVGSGALPLAAQVRDEATRGRRRKGKDDEGRMR